jgi:3-phosphoshikimate 1-carboxyvinyltransferase
VILPGPRGGLNALVRVPPSKSLTNRALIACAVAGGGTIVNPLDSDDTRALASALADAGWAVEWGDAIQIGDRSSVVGRRRLWLGDSGTGARLLLALVAATPGEFLLDGSPRLRQRPMVPLLRALTRLGAHCSSDSGGLPITVAGSVLDGGAVTVRPEVSSQFVSALMLAAPLMRRGLDIRVEGELPSRPYVDLTLDTLDHLGVTVDHEPGSSRWVVAGGQPAPTETAIEGDWSAAAFFVAAAAVGGGRLDIAPLSLDSRQGDRVMCDIVQRAGARVLRIDGGVRVEGPVDRPIEADLIDAPDLFPALATVAATTSPGSRIDGVDHLMHKESDRLSAMVTNLSRLGAALEVRGSTVTVEAPVVVEPEGLRPVTAAADHRIAMAMAVAALAAGPLELDDPACVSKSFPSFWKVWNDLTASEDGAGARP